MILKRMNLSHTMEMYTGNLTLNTEQRNQITNGQTVE